MTHEELMARGKVANGAATVERIDARLKTGRSIYLFNTYETAHKVDTGTTGIFFIEACPEDEEYIRCAQVIPGTVEDIYPHFTDREEYRVRGVPGDDIAKAVVFGDSNGNPGHPMDISRYGVFYSTNEVPSKAELATAKKALIPELQKEIAEADQFFASADPKLVESARNEKYFRAARRLNVKRPWLSEASEMTLCPFCSAPVRPTAPKCPNCHEVINQSAYDALKKQISGAA